MKQPHLLLILVLIALLFSCGEQRRQKKEAKRGFTWVVQGDKGTVLVKDIRSLLKKHSLLFGDRSILETYADEDTAGRFVREGDYLWMALYTSEAENAMGYLCAKRQKNGYFLVLSDAGSDFLGYEDLKYRYLTKAGPYVILMQPAGNGSKIAPEIYNLDGTEIYTNDLLVGGSYCTDLLRAVPDTCYSERVEFIYASGQLQSVHYRTAIPENMPDFTLHRKYKVLYSIRENDLKILDTIELQP